MHHDEIEVPVLIEDEALLPYYTTEEAAGADAHACLREPIVIPPGRSALVPTGMRAAIPVGYEIQVRPRSGLALKNQVTVLNTPGTIDSDYRGEIGIILINHGTQNFTVTHGMRIAQLVLAPTHRAKFVVCSSLSATQRGEGGFGHTGIEQSLNCNCAK